MRYTEIDANAYINASQYQASAQLLIKLCPVPLSTTNQIVSIYAAKPDNANTTPEMRPNIAYEWTQHPQSVGRATRGQGRPVPQYENVT